jgi:myo-inositol-1(or 4)-monophosphatase
MSDSVLDKQLPELLALAKDIALEAGALLVERLTHVRTAISSKSTATDMVSEVDRESESLIVRRILAVRPNDGILGEEGSARAGISGLRWVIDPLDGTTNYLYGIPAFCVSIGVEDAEGVAAGAVYEPVRVEMFSAARGLGAFRDGRAVRVTSQSDPALALVGTGFSYEADRRRMQAERLVKVLPVVRDIRRAGSAALDLCSVACGRLDGYFEEGLNAWDYSAGSLIVAEAGGVFERNEEGLIVAAGPGLFEQLATLVQLR